MRKFILGSVAALSLTACNSGGPTYITSSEVPQPSMNVSATGTVSAAPDRAIVTAGVVSEGKSAREAMINNATLMTTVYEELEAAGIPQKNVNTSQLSLQPRYDYRDRQAPRISGYEARNTVTVKSETLDTVGAMLDALVKAGINNINGVSFSISDPKNAQAEAREEAIKEAKAKAEAMASAAGVKLGPLLSMSENNFSANPRPMMMASRMQMESDSVTPISAGEQSLQVTVNMRYAIEE
jgi:uncharacterized protein YggE